MFLSFVNFLDFFAFRVHGDESVGFFYFIAECPFQKSVFDFKVNGLLSFFYGVRYGRVLVHPIIECCL